MTRAGTTARTHARKCSSLGRAVRNVPRTTYHAPRTAHRVACYTSHPTPHTPGVDCLALLVESFGSGPRRFVHAEVASLALRLVESLLLTRARSTDYRLCARCNKWALGPGPPCTCMVPGKHVHGARCMVPAAWCPPCAWRACAGGFAIGCVM